MIAIRVRPSHLLSYKEARLGSKLHCSSVLGINKDLLARAVSSSVKGRSMPSYSSSSEWL